MCFLYIEPCTDRHKQTSTISGKRETNKPPLASRPSHPRQPQFWQFGPDASSVSIGESGHLRNLPLEARSLTSPTSWQAPQTTRSQKSCPSTNLGRPKKETRVNTTHIRDYFDKWIYYLIFVTIMIYVWFDLICICVDCRCVTNAAPRNPVNQYPQYLPMRGQ